MPNVRRSLPPFLAAAGGAILAALGFAGTGCSNNPYPPGESGSNTLYRVLTDDPKSLDIVPFKRKSVTVAWELMFTRSIFETADMSEQHRILAEVSALVDSGVLRTTLTERAGKIDAASLRKVHAKVEAGQAFGKSVLEGF